MVIYRGHGDRSVNSRILKVELNIPVYDLASIYFRKFSVTLTHCLATCQEEAAVHSQAEFHLSL